MSRMYKMEVSVPEHEAQRLKETIVNSTPSAYVTSSSPFPVSGKPSNGLQEDELTEYGVLTD